VKNSLFVTDLDSLIGLCQVISQFPLAFEFNVYYIETLAYHQSSMRFSTFLLNSEKERYEEGWLPHSLQST
jgi:myotubularin-related protein 5/13